jgi:hypothetical protein
MAGLTVTLKRNDFARIGGEMRKRASVQVRSSVFRIEAGCKQRSRVDTGAMKTGWQGTMEDDIHGSVSNPVEYTIHNEFGTRFMPAQPMLHPAVDEERPNFARGLSEILRG